VKLPVPKSPLMIKCEHPMPRSMVTPKDVTSWQGGRLAARWGGGGALGVKTVEATAFRAASGVVGFGRSLRAHRMATPPQRGWHSGLGARMRCRAWRRTRSNGVDESGSVKAVAGQLNHPEAKRTMLGIADGYERMAKLAENASRSRSLQPRVNPRAPSGSPRCRWGPLGPIALPAVGGRPLRAGGP
jgi:hypothetical protein